MARRQQWMVVSLFMLGVLWYLWNYGTPADIDFGDLPRYRHVSPEMYDKAMDAARAFNKVRRSRSTTNVIEEMAAHLALFSQYANELAIIEDDPVLRQSVEGAERSMHALMEGARVRLSGDQVLVHPIPLPSQNP